MIELYLLEQLVGISQYQTLSEAASKLHVTQPTLTRSIQKLEALLEAPLFTREKNRLRLNENGKVVVEYAKRILALEDELVERVRANQDSSVRVSIGTCAPAPGLVLERAILKGLPAAHVEVTQEDESELITGLKDNRFQYIVLTHELDGPDLECRELGTEHLHVSVLPAHPFALKESVTFEEIDTGVFLVYKALGSWGNVCPDHMPHARFIYQEGMDDYLEVVGSSSLPTFDTDWGIELFGKRANRVSVPIAEDAASMTFFVVAKRRCVRGRGGVGGGGPPPPPHPPRPLT
ncbi:LysR family transcriptional regulator [Eggerthellaceae bacterium zg-887]|uniref:LysR family transcriptional regulator n=1 Tax=Xiamenia xianingshaonis TaxID=2682776 RepID=UPI00140B71E9|nr:LysR family transcriptional regulator [Xiamenia xianingshaonis]NHM16629.1 LysR family transcriptional regulator [Xiamenia xianingshaonis]